MGKLLRFRHASRDHLERFLAGRASGLPAGSRVLDAGAGHCPYRGLFAHAHYETADFCQVDRRYGQIDYVCDLRAIPAEPASYDVVVCTQVLEHLPEPQAVLREYARLLKPSGQLWLTAPLYYEEHEAPHDYFRYTQYGLRHLLAGAGFEVVEFEWLEGYHAALGHQLRKAGRSLSFRPRDYGGGLVGWIAAGAALGLQPTFSLLGYWFNFLDRRHKFTGRGHCINYALVARKAASATLATPASRAA